MKIRSPWKMLALAAIFVLLLTGCATVPMSTVDPKGPVAAMQLDLMAISLWIMMFVLVLVIGIYTYVVIRFRERPNDNREVKEVGNSKLLEFVWITIPLVLITILAVPTVSMAFKLADIPDDEGTLTVRVVGKQYWWEFQYPDLGITTANEMYIPTGQKIALELTSTDVIHAFWVPKLAGKIDTTPGHITKMWIQADEEGVYAGQCAELCGPGHALMAFNVHAVSPEEFEAWTQAMLNPQNEPTSALSQLGEEVFAQQCASCHAIAGTDYIGTFGPDLTRFAYRETLGAAILENNDENLREWIVNSGSIKPGSTMPPFTHLSDEEIDALIAYMRDLK